MDQQSTKKRVPRAILQGPQVTSHKDQPLCKHLQHGLEDHHRPPVSKPSTSQQDPLEHNGTNGSTKAPTNRKGPSATKPKKASTNADAATQPSNTLTCSQCGESGHRSKNCPHNNLFCDFCRVTTHTTRMCRATRCGPGSPVYLLQANPIIVLPIVDTGPKITGRSLGRHQML